DGITPIIATSGPNAGIASIGNTIFVDEYTPAGTLVQSLILPSADSLSYRISTATESGTTVTITTTAPVSFTAGQQVTITQTSLNGYNGPSTITGVPTATSFTYTASSSGLGNAVGGTAAGTIHAVVADGQQQATGQMSLSGDGQFLFLTGYDSNPLNPATAPQLHSSNTTSRAVARIKYDGTIPSLGVFAGSGGVQTAGNINGVYSPDGNRFYISGYNGIDYFSSFTPSGSLRFYNEKTNSTAPVTGLQGVGGNLYAEGLNY